MPAYFTKHLLQWHFDNPRPLPWDGMPRDAYHIWVSEIILQQTRMEQGAPYFKKFIARFPNVYSLAIASENEVIKHWQGLGYYARARNMHRTAKIVANELNGIFPNTYESLLSLPGIGMYTAAAIASFAYGLPHPVVDGNVKRVITRFYGIFTPMSDNALHQQVEEKCKPLLRGVSPGAFNQAIMNFGALVCTPGIPDCTSCPVHRKCYAYQNNCVSDLPVRTEKKSNRVRFLHFVVLQHKGKILLEKRQGKDIWHGLFTPPVFESSSSRKPALRQFSAFFEKQQFPQNFIYQDSSSIIRQELSHQSLQARFHFLELPSLAKKLNHTTAWVSKKTYHNYGKPKIVAEMLDMYFSST